MIITICGPPGAGSTTIGKRLADVLNYPFLSMGELNRRIAQEEGMDIREFWERYKNLEQFHLALDQKQKEMVKRFKSVVVDSRLGAFILNPDVAIYLYCPLKIRAERVAKRDGKDFNDALKDIEGREKKEREFFKKLYGFDYAQDFYVYDAVINTEKLSIDQCVEIIKKICEVKA